VKVWYFPKGQPWHSSPRRLTKYLPRGHTAAVHAAAPPADHVDSPQVLQLGLPGELYVPAEHSLQLGYAMYRPATHTVHPVARGDGEEIVPYAQLKHHS